MQRPVLYTEAPDFDSYSQIIDVRSPGEFAEDHVPGAVNYYALNNEERAKVGTLYTQVSPFEARKLGASLISANISNWLREELADHEADFKPLIYCWRGGQRSGSFGTILSAIGWESTLIKGGYKHYRHMVIDQLKTLPSQYRLVILSGLTGTAKTRILTLLAEAGEQVLDLEGMANHRGSLLGWQPDQPQPTQKMFETLLADKLKRFDTRKPVWVEAESNKIGNIHCPAEFWKEMQQAPRIEIQAPIEARVEYLVGDYAFLTDHIEDVKRRLGFLKEQHGTKQITEWGNLLENGQLPELAASLLINHYDPSYSNSAGRYSESLYASVSLSSLQDDALRQAIPVLILQRSGAAASVHA